jgi:hypothetical protein
VLISRVFFLGSMLAFASCGGDVTTSESGEVTAPVPETGTATLTEPIEAACEPLPMETQNVTLAPQETSLWCWAASGEMIAESIVGSDVKQCDAATWALNDPDVNCCDKPTPSDCVQKGWPDEIFTRSGLTWKKTVDEALDVATVKSQISNQSGCGNRPFAFSWHYIDRIGGHMMVARSFKSYEIPAIKTDDEITPARTFVQIEVNDPLPSTQDPPPHGSVGWMTYDYFVSASNRHTHWNDYYDIRRTE